MHRLVYLHIKGTLLSKAHLAQNLSDSNLHSVGSALENLVLCGIHLSNDAAAYG